LEGLPAARQRGTGRTAWSTAPLRWTKHLPVCLHRTHPASHCPTPQVLQDNTHADSEQIEDGAQRKTVLLNDATLTDLILCVLLCIVIRFRLCKTTLTVACALCLSRATDAQQCIGLNHMGCVFVIRLQRTPDHCSSHMLLLGLVAISAIQQNHGFRVGHTCVTRSAKSSLWETVVLINRVAKIAYLQDGMCFIGFQQNVLQLYVSVNNTHSAQY